MNMIRGEQLHNVVKGTITGQMACIVSLFEVVALARLEVRLYAHRCSPREFLQHNQQRGEALL
jgi:hypothetical protein